MVELLKVEFLKEQKYCFKELLLKCVESNLGIYEDNSYGILYNNELIGLIGVDSFFNNVSLSVLLLNEYKGKGYALSALNRFVELYGIKYKEFEKFLCITNPNNYRANSSLNKSDWDLTHDYDEDMLYEGGAFYNIYYKKNPYFIGKRLIKNDK